MYGVVSWSVIGFVFWLFYRRKFHRQSKKTASEHVKLELEHVKTERFLLELQEVLEIKNLSEELFHDQQSHITHIKSSIV